MRSIVSGLDWSGDSGDPAKAPGTAPYLILVVAYVDENALPEVEGVLDQVRRVRALGDRFVFHYSACRDVIRQAFFEQISRLPCGAYARVIDKRDWSGEYLRRLSGDDRLRDEIVRLLLDLPAFLVARQRLIVDYPTSEAKKVQAIRRDFDLALRVQKRSGYRTIRPCPDHRAQGTLVQIADMIAGALRDGSPETKQWLRGLGRRIEVL